jgi:hypothetical protein
MGAEEKKRVLVAKRVRAPKLTMSFSCRSAKVSKLHTDVDPPSSTLGSDGGGPSMAQRFDSYLDRINESILLQTDVRGPFCLV